MWTCPNESYGASCPQNYESVRDPLEGLVGQDLLRLAGHR